ncbi:MAG: 4Fe-4S binding protein [Methanosarcinales archaeon]
MVSVVKVQDYLCSSAGQESIRKDLEKGKINRVVLGSCSPKLHLETFRKMAREYINPYLLEITNIREQCSWVHSNKASATNKATGLIKGAIRRMALLADIEPIKKDIKNKVLVVGGGIAGITAALELAEYQEVILIERLPYLGGHMIGLSKTFPTLDCSQCILTPKMVSVITNPNITLYTQTEVGEVYGGPGDYKITLKVFNRGVDLENCINCGLCAKVCKHQAIYLPFAQAIPQAHYIDFSSCVKCGECEKVCPRKAINLNQEYKEEEIEVGSVVLATGFEPIEVSYIEQYNTWHPDIINAIEFEEMLSAKSKTGMRLQKSDGSFPNKVAFVLCVGSRDYSISEFRNPQSAIQNLKAPNKYCSKVCCIYAQKQAQLIKKMKASAEVWIFYIDIRSAGRRFEEFYYHTQELGIQFVRGKVAEIIPEEEGLRINYEDTLLGITCSEVFDMVVLCPSLNPSKGTMELANKFQVPIGADGFIEEKHVKIDPVNTVNASVFAAGCALGPKDIHDSVTEGISASHKVASFLKKSFIEIPISSPEIEKSTCDGCGKCIEECPYDAISIMDGVAILDTLKCQQCGICVPVCPLMSIEIKNYTRDQLIAQAKGILEEGSGVIAFIDREAYAAADLAGVNRMVYSPLIRFI